MSDPIIEIGAWALPASKWARLFRRKPLAILERYKIGLPPAVVVFGFERKARPPSGVTLRVGELEMPISRWAARTGQRSGVIERHLKSGLSHVEAIFHDPPTGYRTST
ncbi:MAG: hypothetical protein AAFU85_13435 [Planctomycetota bacterium]